jgi:hypothetical protein
MPWDFRQKADFFLSLPSLSLLSRVPPLYVAQAGLELKIVLLEPPKCWDYRSSGLFPGSNSLVIFWFVLFI